MLKLRNQCIANVKKRPLSHSLKYNHEFNLYYLGCVDNGLCNKVSDYKLANMTFILQAEICLWLPFSYRKPIIVKASMGNSHIILFGGMCVDTVFRLMLSQLGTGSSVCRQTPTVLHYF